MEIQWPNPATGSSRASPQLPCSHNIWAAHAFAVELLIVLWCRGNIKKMDPAILLKYGKRAEQGFAELNLGHCSI